MISVTMERKVLKVFYKNDSLKLLRSICVKIYLKCKLELRVFLRKIINFVVGSFLRTLFEKILSLLKNLSSAEEVSLEWKR